MSNRMAEQGLGSNSSKNGSINEELKIADPKEFLAKYKENELRNNSVVNNLNELTAATAAVNHSHPHRISPRLAQSPSANSDGSLGRSVSSPFHPSLFDSAKMSHSFTNAYLPAAAAAAAVAVNQQAAAAAAFNSNEFQKEFNNLANRFNSASIPLAPISPLSPLNAAVNRLFLQNTMFNKRLSEIQKLQSEQLLLNHASRLLSPALNSNVFRQPSSKDLIENMTNGIKEFYGDTPEQERPIDLSVKRLTEFKELTLAAVELAKCSKNVPGDRDSGFSPSSNEDNHNTSPLDLTSNNSSLSTNRNLKRPCLVSSRNADDRLKSSSSSTSLPSSLSSSFKSNKINSIINKFQNNKNNKLKNVFNKSLNESSISMDEDDVVFEDDEIDDDDDDVVDDVDVDVDVDVEVDVDVDEEVDDDEDDDHDVDDRDDEGGDGDDETSDIELTNRNLANKSSSKSKSDLLDVSSHHHQLTSQKVNG